MKKLFFIFYWLIFFWAQVAAQLDFIPVHADYACFKGSDKAYTEIYLSFSQSDLTYSLEDSMYVSHFDHTVKISQQDSVLLTIQRNYKNAIIHPNDINKNSQFMDVFFLELNPGTYQLVASIHDQVTEKSGEYTQEMTVPAFSKELALSHLQLSTKIEKTDRKSNFSTKNNIEIIPNPSRVYGVGSPMLYFYFEIYNLMIDREGNNKYSYHYYISDSEGRRLRDFPEKIKSNNTNTVAEASGTNIITLSTDTYYLNLEVKDLLTDKNTFTRKKFSIDKPNRQVNETQIEARLAGYEEYMNFTEQQLRDEFEKAAYLAIPEEKKVYAQLDIEGMKRFLAEFWKRRDTDPSTLINEFKRTYFENLQLVNAQFSSNFKEGWRTDQGRILLVYGKPDEIQRNPSSINAQPYEIWYYYSLEGGAEFILGDLTGHGEYELLHSTYRNEIKDPNWQLRLGGVRTRERSSGFDNY